MEFVTRYEFQEKIIFNKFELLFIQSCLPLNESNSGHGLVTFRKSNRDISNLSIGSRGTRKLSKGCHGRIFISKMYISSKCN